MPTAVPYVQSSPGAFVAGMLAVALQVGTGGDATASYYVARGSRGYAPTGYGAPTGTIADIADRIPHRILRRFVPS